MKPPGHPYRVHVLNVLNEEDGSWTWLPKEVFEEWDTTEIAAWERHLRKCEETLSEIRSEYEVWEEQLEAITEEVNEAKEMLKQLRKET